MTCTQAQTAKDHHEQVFFQWRGRLCCSPILRVNARTATVATVHGERRVPFARLTLSLTVDN